MFWALFFEDRSCVLGVLMAMNNFGVQVGRVA